MTWLSSRIVTERDAVAAYADPGRHERVDGYQRGSYPEAAGSVAGKEIRRVWRQGRQLACVCDTIKRLQEFKSSKDQENKSSINSRI